MCAFHALGGRHSSTTIARSTHLTVVLAVLRFVRMVTRPRYEVLGVVPRMPGLRSWTDILMVYAAGPSLVSLQFSNRLFNAPYFKRAVLDAVNAAGPGLRWLVLDAVPVTNHDVTGRFTLRELERDLGSREMGTAIAGRQTEFMDWRRARGFHETRPTTARLFPTLRRAAPTLQA